MTTYGDLHCITCGKRMGLSNARAYVAVRLLAIAPELTALARHVGEVDMALDVEFVHASLWWFSDHGAHELAAINEYGVTEATTLGDDGEPRGPL